MVVAIESHPPQQRLPDMNTSTNPIVDGPDGATTGKTMKALRFHGRQDLRLDEVEEPTCGYGQVKVFPSRANGSLRRVVGDG